MGACITWGQLNMMCSFYKPKLKDYRLYVYLCAETLLIALSNAWFLYHHNFKILQPNKKFMPLKKIQAEVVASFLTVSA